MLAGGMLAGSLGGGKKQEANLAPSPEQQAAIDRQNRPLSQVKIQTRRAPMPGDEDLRNYGRSGTREYDFFRNNQLPAMAEGGYLDAAMPMAHDSGPRYIEGPGSGREDKIPSLLSDGEYVMDAEIVAMLGDGSSEAGAGVLDKMRENIRRHKGQRLAKGAISPDAKPAEAYLPKGAL
jgi:hypothetical protein